MCWWVLFTIFSSTFYKFSCTTIYKALRIVCFLLVGSMCRWWVLFTILQSCLHSRILGGSPTSPTLNIHHIIHWSNIIFTMDRVYNRTLRRISLETHLHLMDSHKNYFSLRKKYFHQFVLPKEQELIPEYWVNIFRASVRPSVRPSVRASVRPSVRPSVPLQISVGWVYFV